MRLLSGRTRRLSLVELSAQLGLPKGTVFGILRTLQQVGFVEKDADSASTSSGRRCSTSGAATWTATSCATRALNWADSLAARVQRGGADRHPPRRPGAGGSSRLPPRRQLPGAPGGLAAAPPRHRPGQDAAGRQPLPDRPARPRGPDPLHPLHDHRRQAADAALPARSRASAGRRTSASWSTARGRSPPRSPTGASRPSARSPSRGRSSGSANRQSAPHRPGLLRARIGAGDLARSGGDPVVAGPRAARRRSEA